LMLLLDSFGCGFFNEIVLWCSSVWCCALRVRNDNPQLVVFAPHFAWRIFKSLNYFIFFSTFGSATCNYEVHPQLVAKYLLSKPLQHLESSFQTKLVWVCYIMKQLVYVGPDLGKNIATTRMCFHYNFF
jgi:hypothetical protein